VGIDLGKEIKELFNDEQTVKVLATTDKDGTPHAVFKASIDMNEDGNIQYLELIESSQTNMNMVNSIWFKHKVAISIKTQDGRSYQIKGTPIKTHISGAIFEKYYKQARQKLNDSDLAAVWIIEPEEVINESYEYRKKEEETKHPLLKHLDRLV
jgi:hypothetical protein